MSVYRMHITTAIGTPSLGHIGTELSPAATAVKSSDTTCQKESLITCNDGIKSDSSTFISEINSIETRGSPSGVENISDHSFPDITLSDDSPKRHKLSTENYDSLMDKVAKIAPMSDETYSKLIASWYEEKSDIVADLLSRLTAPIKDPKSLAFILSIVSFTVKITLCSTSNQFLLHVADFMRENYLTQICALAGKLKMSLAMWFEIIRDSIKGVIVTESYLEQGIDIFLKILKGSICAAVSNIILTLVGLKFFEYEKAMNLTTLLGKPKGGSIFETLEHVLGNVKILLLGSYEALCGGKSFYDVITADYSASCQRERLAYLKAFKDLRYIGLPIEGFEEEATYAMKAREAQEQYKLLQKSLPRSVVKSEAFVNDGVFINTICGDISRASSSKMRVPPFGIILHGKPGIGKAGIVSYIPKIWCAAKGIAYDPTHLYHKNPHDPFASGFSNQPFCHMSEVGNLHPNIAKVQGDELLNQVLSLIDSQPYCMEMAAIEDKGKAWANFQLVLIDTNNPSLNANHVAFNPAAIARRFLTVNMTVRPEYQKAGSCEIDTEKAADVPDHDVWLFDISRQLVDIGGNTSTQVYIERAVDLKTMTQTMHNLFITYLTNQTRAAEAIDKMDPKIYLESLDVSGLLFKHWPVVANFCMTYRVFGISFILHEALFWYHQNVTIALYGNLIFTFAWLVFTFCDAFYLLRERINPYHWYNITITKMYNDRYALGIFFIFFFFFECMFTQSAAIFLSYLDMYHGLSSMECSLFCMLVAGWISYETRHAAHTFESFHSHSIVRVESKLTNLYWRYNVLIFTQVYISLSALCLYGEWNITAFIFALAAISEMSSHFPDFHFYFTIVFMRPTSIVYRLIQWKEDIFRIITTLKFFSLIVFNGFLISLLLPFIIILGLCGNSLTSSFKLYKLGQSMHNRKLDCRYFWYCAKHVWFPVAEKPILVPAKHVNYYDALTIAAGVISAFALSLNIANRFKLNNLDKKIEAFKSGSDKGEYQNALNNYTFRKGMEEMHQPTVSTESKIEARLPETDEMEIKLGCAVPPKRTNKNIEWEVLQFTQNRPTPQMLNERPAVQNAINRNLRYVSVTNGNSSFNTHLLGIKSNVAIINRHVLRQKIDGSPTTWTFTVVTRDIRSVHVADANSLTYIHGDLMLVTLSGLKFKDITAYFPTKPVDFSLGVKSFINDESTTAYKTPNVEALNGDRKFQLTDIVKYSYITHGQGDCGTPLISQVGQGWCVSAIHSAGTKEERMCYGTLITADQIDIAYKELQKHSNGLMEILSEGHMNFDLEKIHSKHPFNYSYTPGVEWYGQIKGSQAMKGKSKVELSLIADDLPALIGESLYEGDKLKFSGPDLTSNAPWTAFLDRYESPMITLHPWLVGETVECVFDHMKQFVGKIAPLTLDVALNGAPEDPYIRGINLSTSGAFGYPGGKKAWTYGDKPNAHFVGEIQSAIVSKVSDYFDGRETCSPIIAALKDEVRTAKKLARMFCMTDEASLGLQRMMLAPIFSALTAGRPKSGSCVGINMQSKDVGEFVEYLGEDKRMVEGDYREFDDMRCYSIPHMAVSVLYKLGVYGGYNTGACRVLQGVLSESLHPFLSIYGAIGCFPGKQPSGKYGTAEDNCLRNILMLIYWLLHLMVTNQLPKMNPFDIITPGTYGDDLLSSVNERFVHVVNLVNYKQFCKEHYGIVVTAANKSEIVPPTIGIEEASFLKRKFVKKIIPNGTEQWVAPLEMASIAKCMGFILPSNSVDKATQLIESCISSSRELVAHFDKDRHDRFRNDVCKLLSVKLERDLDVLLKVFPTYEKIFDSMFPSGGNMSKTPSDKEKSALNLTALADVTSVPLIIAESKPTDSFRRVVRESTTLPKYALVIISYLATNVLGSPVLMVDINPPMNNFKNITKQFIEKELMDATPLPQNLTNRWKLVVNMHNASKVAYHPATDAMNLEDLICNPQMRYDPSTALAYKCRLAELRNVEAQRRTNDTMSRNHKRLAARRLARAKNLKVVTEATVGDMVDGPAVGERLGTNLQVSGAPPEVMSLLPKPSETANGNNTQFALDDFFERPFSIYDSQFAVGSSPEVALDVWELWSNSEAVRMKMRNYTYFKGTLHVRISVTGTPFHYGRLMVSYYPYPGYNEVLSELTTVGTLAASRMPFIYHSQSSATQMTIDINANQPMDVVLPFCSPKQAFSLMNYTSAAIIPSVPFDDFTIAGTLYIRAINPILLAMDAAESPISINVMAWMTDVELSIPTSTVILTEGKAKKSVGGKKNSKTFSSDTVTGTAAKGFWKAIEHDPAKSEYTDPGPLTQMSSVVADIGEKLSDVPFIGSFAQATGKIAGKLGQVFSMFGWSRPVVLEKPIFVKNMAYTNGATTAGSETTYKLTVDPKQETTVDPTIAGGIEADELCFATLNSRESYLTTFAWTSADVALVDELFVSQVMPTLCDSMLNTAVDERFIQPTILGYTSIPFDYWHGDITFRFDIVCSKFHRGKLLITFEPNIYQRGLILSSPATFNQQNSLIIDIQEVQECEFEVQWCSDWRWLPLPTQVWGAFKSPTFAVGDELTFSETSLGYISVTPLNELVQPIDNAPIAINVYVRSDRMEYAVPTSVSMPVSRVYTESKNILVPTDDKSELDTIVNFGEKLASFRPLLKRYQVNTMEEVDTAGGYLVYTAPLYPAIQHGVNFDTGSAFPNIYEYLRYAYFAVRGGMRFRFRPLGTYYSNTWVVVNRTYVDGSSPFGNWTTITKDPTPALGTTFFGGNAYHLETNGGVEFEVPYYSNQNFMISPQQNYMTTSPSISEPYHLGFTVLSSVGDTSINVIETSTAEDFNFSRFLGAPFFVLAV